MSYKLAGVIWNDDGTLAKEGYIAEYKGIPIYETDMQDMRKRLDLADRYGELKEYFGIDLSVLINIFANGFYAWVKDNHNDEPYIFHFDARDIELCIEGRSLIVYEQWSESVYGEFPFTEYGTIWASTKEELE